MTVILHATNTGDNIITMKILTMKICIFDNSHLNTMTGENKTEKK